MPKRGQTSSFKKIFQLIFLWGALTASSLSLTEASILIPYNPFSSTDPFGLSPFWNWKTFTTENFRFVFPAELQALAEKAALDLEDTHSFLSPILRWQPRSQVSVLVIDNSDAANGLTAAAARLGMVLWVTPPESWYSTAFYDDWLRLLVIHEYTHFLNMDAKAGIWAPLNTLFGGTGLPNSLWYPWMLEGLAVYMETRFTQLGRGRSSYYSMMVRAAVEENVLESPEFLTLDKLVGTNPYFPEGDTRYQFGYHLMNQAAQEKLHQTTPESETSIQTGEEILGALSERSSRRIPYFINGNLENITGKDWYETWDQ